MKKTLSILVFLFTIVLLINFANASQPPLTDLTTLDMSINKTILKPNEEIELNINFGENLTSFNFVIAYDKNLVEYVSSNYGTVIDNGINVNVSYNNESAPLNDLKIIFKGKENIITSNPTNFAITASELKKENSSYYFNNITVSIIKNFVVEPEYEEYKMDLKYEGNIIVGKQKNIRLEISSAMARPYEHARIIIETSKPVGAAVKLLGIDENGLKHDMIQSGWGDASGYQMGGKNISKILDLEGTFYDIGDYTITVKMIDRDNSDSIISQKSFPITVKEVVALEPENNTISNTTVGAITNNQPQNTSTNTTKNDTLLNTGSDGFFQIFIFTAVLVIGYLYLENKKKSN